MLFCILKFIRSLFLDLFNCSNHLRMVSKSSMVKALMFMAAVFGMNPFGGAAKKLSSN
jgi:hypothetical protein